MCRSQADGGRRCPGGGRRAAPPDDGKIRTEVHTNKRSYSFIGGVESKVTWLPGEKVVSMDPIKPGHPGAGGAAQGGDTGAPPSARRRSKADEDRAAAEERAADTRRQISEGKSITEILSARVREQALGVREAADRRERESQARPGNRW